MNTSIAMPVLMVTSNPELGQTWLQLPRVSWELQPETDVARLAAWRDTGQSLVLIDVALLDEPLLDASALLQLFHGLRVLVLSEHPHDVQGQRMLAAGACGYAHARLPPEGLHTVLSSIHDGNIWLGRSLLQRLLHNIEQRIPLQAASWKEGLTLREQEVAQWAAVGDSNAAIAQRLDITERTVRAHLSAVFDKLHVSDRLKLALKVHGIQH